MSGHSKWNNIKNRKAAVDGKRSRIFTQLAKNIRMAVKEGGSGDPRFNSSLRLLLEKAREANMPKDKVQKAIDVGLGKGEGANSQEVVYEGFGPGGVGLMAVSMTNNHNRTSGEIRNILSKAGGSLGAPGCVRYMFERSENNEFVLTMPMAVSDEDTQVALQELLDELVEHDDVEEVYCVGEWEGKE